MKNIYNTVLTNFTPTDVVYEATGLNNFVITTNPKLQKAIKKDTLLAFMAPSTNTSSCTIKVDCMDSRYPLLSSDNKELVAGQIKVGMVIVCLFTGESFVMAGADAYTKAETDAKFLDVSAQTVSLGNKKLRFANTNNYDILTASDEELASNYSLTQHGDINISEDGLDIKSNYSTSIVVNNNDTGKGYFRVYEGSGRERLLEVGLENFTYGSQNYKVYHEGFKPDLNALGAASKDEFDKHIHPNATTIKDGFLAKEDKSKIDEMYTGKIDKSSIVNDLITGGTDKVLSAEMGKLIKQLLDAGGSGANVLAMVKSISYSDIVTVTTMDTGGKTILCENGLVFNPFVYVDGTLVPPNEYTIDSNSGVITFKTAFGLPVNVCVIDKFPSEVKFAVDTLNLVVNTKLKDTLVENDIIAINGENEIADGGAHRRIVKSVSGLNAIDLGNGLFLNEIPNSRGFKSVGLNHTIALKDSGNYDEIILKENNEHSYLYINKQSTKGAIGIYPNPNRNTELDLSFNKVKVVGNEVYHKDNAIDLFHEDFFYLKLNGDPNTFYPVLIKYPKSEKFYNFTISKSIHDYQQGDGYFSMTVKDMMTMSWGNTTGHDPYLTLIGSYDKFLGKVRRAGNNDANLVLKLKGGRTYAFNTSGGITKDQVSVHYERVEITGSGEEQYKHYEEPSSISELNTNSLNMLHSNRTVTSWYGDGAGYIKYPNGTIMQWGTTAAITHTQASAVASFPLPRVALPTINFHIPFTRTPVVTLQTRGLGAAGAADATEFTCCGGLASVNIYSGASAYRLYGTNTNGSEQFVVNWFAIGS